MTGPAAAPIERIAIVNRGEAATRGINAVIEYRNEARRPITVVALCTEPDRSALFARLADEVVSLGPALFVDPADGRRKHRYLDLDLLEQVLTDARVDAVWPGWGLVAESADFVARCERNGITFIGPSAAVMRRLGDKIASKELAEQAGVPVVPWSGGAVDDLDAARAHAERLGYPLMVKASAGGGGRGIRVARSDSDLPLALAEARAEAKLAFGDPRVFLEQMVTGARHIEVQVIADTFGSTWAVGVRDCSVQRRNQKVVEESARALLDPEMHDAVQDAATRLCRASGYHSAGTVEFLLLPDRGPLFMEVNARLQVEHPVTELTADVDLVKLQLHVAEGGRLEGPAPQARGHAVEVRLNAEDPESDFAPAPGRLAVLRTPTGPGIRVDTGVVEGDEIAPEFDSMIAKIIARGADRPEALARMRRALEQTSVVVEGGTTNKAFLLALLDHPDVVAGPVDTGWLDRIGVAGIPARERHSGLAVLVAALEAYDLEGHVDEQRFFAAALRGRPEVRPEDGRSFELRHRAVRCHTVAYRLGRRHYRVVVDGRPIDVEFDHLGANERRLRLPGGEHHRVVTVTRGGVHAIEIDGVPHTVVRSEGGVVRAASPGVIVSIAVQPGDHVQSGDPLLVLESMKMEVTVVAPLPGRVRSVDARENLQVVAGAALMTIEPLEPTASVPAAHTDLGIVIPELPAPQPEERCADAFARLRARMLGYNVDPADPAPPAQLQDDLCNALPLDDPRPRAYEESLLDLFTDLCVLSRRQPDPDADEQARSPQEYLWTYLRNPDRGREEVPQQFLGRLQRALTHYDVNSLDRTPDLDEALFWMFRSVQRLADHVHLVESILDRRLAWSPPPGAPTDGDALRGVLDRLIDATDGRYQTVCDLARDVRYAWFDRPLLDRASVETLREMRAHLEAIAAGVTGDERDARLRALVECPLTLQAHLAAWIGAGGAGLRAAAVETLVRRYYRIRDLRDLTIVDDVAAIVTAEYAHDGAQIRLVAAGGPADALADVLERVQASVAAAPADHDVVIDLYLEAKERLPFDDTTNEVQSALTAVDFGRPVRRVVVTLGHPPPGPIDAASDCFTFRDQDGAFGEEALYRGLHPMLAKRLELWRLDEFDTQRLPSSEDMFLFHGVARSNPRDERLFAFVEVRDLTPVRDDTGRIVALPQLERQYIEALAAIRSEQSRRAPHRLTTNRVVLSVDPPWTVDPDDWRAIADRLGPASRGLGLEKVVLSIRQPVDGEARARIIEITTPAQRGLHIRYGEPEGPPIQPLTEYGLRVAATQRRGYMYPYELLRMITPDPDDVVDSPFPPGEFQELDLDDRGALVPVDRPPGQNESNIVVGLIRSFTGRYPEGMERVVLLGDPSRNLGSLAEPECRRILGALDVASQRGVPLEWFALSAGAKIAMDSGTENMDWIAAVLRRIIEFTQAGGACNVVVAGINVGAQPYWNAEATMLMHTRGILVMIPDSAMVLTGKQALEFSGGVSAEDNLGIGGYQRIMGPNGQAQYWAPDIETACRVLLRHYEHTYVAPGERFPRRASTNDPIDRDVRTYPHARIEGTDFATVGDVMSDEHNPERKRPFDIRSVMRAVTDQDHDPMERWERMYGGESSVVWDAHLGGIPVCLIGFESRQLPRYRFIPADGPTAWTSGTLFPQASKKTARAINAASGNRPLVVLANLSGFDGSPESMRSLQLEFGAEIGRAVTNFRGPIVFCVISRYHGGAFVVFSKRLNDDAEVAAVEGSYASVIGGAPAAAVVFTREVDARTDADPRVLDARARLDASAAGEAPQQRQELAQVRERVRAEKMGEVAREFDETHSIHRAQRMGSVDRIVTAAGLRPYLVDALERGIERTRAGEPPHR